MVPFFRTWASGITRTRAGTWQNDSAYAEKACAAAHHCEKRMVNGVTLGRFVIMYKASTIV